MSPLLGSPAQAPGYRAAWWVGGEDGGKLPTQRPCLQDGTFIPTWLPLSAHLAGQDWSPSPMHCSHSPDISSLV